MDEGKNKKSGELRFLLRGVLSWLLCSLVLLLIFSLIVSKSELSSGALGYISSCISFAAAFAAGFAACRGTESGIIYRALICAGVIIVLSLTLGYITGGHDIRPSGILSVVSFTLSGCLLGGVLSSAVKKSNKTKKIKPKRR